MDSRVYEQFNKRAPFRLTGDNMIVLARIGSHSHGTYVPPTDPDAIDDVDFMGIVVPPIEFTLGTRQWEGLNFQYEELDCVFYSLSKFIRLLLKANPNVLGLLWLRPEDLFHSTEEWDNLVRHRSYFASLGAYNAFAGYAAAQLHKMTAFDAAVTDEWDKAVALVTAAGWAVDDITDKSKSLPMPNYRAVRQHIGVGGKPDDFFDAWLNAAKTSIQKIHARHFQGYMGEKRKRLVKRYGYDTKNAAHLIRLLRMAVEFLHTGELAVFRPDAAEIMEIKQGGWTLDRVKRHAEELFEDAKQARATSNLPEGPNVEKIDKLTVHTHLSVYGLDP